MKIRDRVFVSFDEPCSYQCKHCYTYGIKRNRIRSTKEIVESIENERFDVIYVSQKNDNFSDALKGIDLCRSLFTKYNSHLFIITRNVFNSHEITELENLQRQMKLSNKNIFIAISLNALESIAVCENADKVPSPEKRIEFIKKLSERGLNPILMLRPIFPNKIIPTDECLRIIDAVCPYVSCVVTGGLGVNDDVLERLGMLDSAFSYNKDQEYLQGAIDCEIKFVDVQEELEQIYNKCQSLNIPLFSHSMPAINYISEIDS